MRANRSQVLSDRVGDRVVLLIENRSGIVNYYLSRIALGPLPLLSSPALALVSIIAANVWRGCAFGFVNVWVGCAPAGAVFWSVCVSGFAGSDCSAPADSYPRSFSPRAVSNQKNSMPARLAFTFFQSS